MIRITDKSLCCGCTACVNACPVQCIVMRRDREGFDYPVANPDFCISCGKCETVCPVLNPQSESDPLAVFAARSEADMEGSSSGGLFPMLAGKYLQEGGVVYGAAFMEDMTVGHADVTDSAGLERLKGSKYVQSDLYAVFEEVRDLLEDGKRVLFAGTPCQIAGLDNYLGGRKGNLLAVDVACHGAPSPGLWEKYVAAYEKRSGGRLCRVSFRDKSESWRQYSVKYDVLYDGVVKSHRVHKMDDPYMALFLQDMTLRPSCYSCPARNGRSGSDLTLADLWNVSEVAPEFDDDRGASLVLVNTDAGLRMFDALVRDGLKTVPADFGTGRKRNAGFDSALTMPEKREEFFKGVHSAEDLIGYMSAFVVRKTLFRTVYEKVHTFLAVIKKKLLR